MVIRNGGMNKRTLIQVLRTDRLSEAEEDARLTTVTVVVDILIRLEQLPTTPLLQTPTTTTTTRLDKSLSSFSFFNTPSQRSQLRNCLVNQR